MLAGQPNNLIMASSFSNPDAPSSQPADNPTQNPTPSSPTEPRRALIPGSSKTRTRSVSNSGRSAHVGTADARRPNPYPNIAAKIDNKSNYTAPNWRSPLPTSTQSTSRRPSISTAVSSRHSPSLRQKDESETRAEQSPTLIESPDEGKQDENNSPELRLGFHPDINNWILKVLSRQTIGTAKSISGNGPLYAIVYTFSPMLTCSTYSLLDVIWYYSKEVSDQSFKT